MDRYAYPFLIALMVSLMATPIIRAFALRVGAVVMPKNRGVHTAPVPHLGGVAIYLAFLCSVLCTFEYIPRSVAGIILGGAFILTLGVVDDFIEFSPRAKFLGQIAGAAILIACGVQIKFLTNPFGGMIVFSGWVSILLTGFWIVSVMNIMNLIDGLDGLAAGISTIASITLLMVALQTGYGMIVLLTGAIAGSSLGFLPYNFNPARIFMGDAGAMFIGYVLAAISVEGTLKSAAAIALAIPILALGVPIFDTAFAMVRRFLNGRPIYEADKGHLHHRLLAMGLNQRQTVIVMYLVSSILGLSALLLTRIGPKLGLPVITLVLLSLILGARRVGVLRIQVHHQRNSKQG